MLLSVLVQVISYPMKGAQIGAVVTPTSISCSHPSPLSLAWWIAWTKHSNHHHQNGVPQLSSCLRVQLFPPWSTWLQDHDFSERKALAQECWVRVLKRYHKRVFHDICDSPTCGTLPFLLMSLITLMSLVRGGDTNLQEYSRHLTRLNETVI